MLYSFQYFLNFISHCRCVTALSFNESQLIRSLIERLYNFQSFVSNHEKSLFHSIFILFILFINNILIINYKFLLFIIILYIIIIDIYFYLWSKSQFIFVLNM